MNDEGNEVPGQSASTPWREQLLRGLLLVGLAMTTLVMPLLIVQVRIYESAVGIFVASAAYLAVLSAVLARRAPYRLRALGLLVSLGARACSGFLRVGFRSGPAPAARWSWCRPGSCSARARCGSRSA